MALHDLDPETHLRDPARKQGYVTTLFDTIAPGYDRFTRLFSFGMDRVWKRRIAVWVAEVVEPGDLVLDLACGTGDLIEAVMGKGIGKSGERGGLVGIDPSAEMLRVARRRLAPLGPPIPLLPADMMSLPIADGAAAAVTVGYGFRNAPDARAALQEVARVLRPGGWLADLDFFLPENVAWRRVYLWYLRVTGRAIGRWWHGEPEAYGYIARSLEHWVTPRGFQEMLQRAGFRVTRVRRYLGGGICLHFAQLGL